MIENETFGKYKFILLAESSVVKFSSLAITETTSYNVVFILQIYSALNELLDLLLMQSIDPQVCVLGSWSVSTIGCPGSL